MTMPDRIFWLGYAMGCFTGLALVAVAACLGGRKINKAGDAAYPHEHGGWK